MSALSLIDGVMPCCSESSQRDLREARAAVAELVEAANDATEERMHDGASSRVSCDRLVAALARVQGGQS